MRAYLRASAYPEKGRSSRPATNHLDGAAAVTKRSGSFLNLLREYDNQARDNFAKEAVVFTIIIIAGLVWPVVQSVQALAF